MKILHYLDQTRLERGGVVRAVLDLCSALAKRDCEVTLATYDPLDVPKEWFEGGPGMPRVEVLPAGINRLGLLRKPALARLDQLIAKHDLLQMHVLWLPSHIQACRAARHHGKPFLFSAHGMLDQWSISQRALKKRLFLALFGRRIFREARAIHCTAKAEAEQAAHVLAEDNTTIIPYIFDKTPYVDAPGPALARKLFSIDQDKINVLFLSRLHKKKGIESLIDATHALKSAGMPIRTLIAGVLVDTEESYRQGLRDRIADLGLEQDVDLLGLVVGQEKVSLYQAADMFVLPTSQENFGLVLIESLAVGTPVITTKGVDIWRELEQSGGALIVKSNATALADAIRSLAEDPDRRSEMGRSGREGVLNWLDSDRIIEQYEQLYRNTLETSA